MENIFAAKCPYCNHEFTARADTEDVTNSRAKLLCPSCEKMCQVVGAESNYSLVIEEPDSPKNSNNKKQESVNLAQEQSPSIFEKYGAMKIMATVVSLAIIAPIILGLLSGDNKPKDNKPKIETYKWANGDEYVGEFVDGKRTGQGKITWANGDSFTGQFVEGEITGQGKYTWANGDACEGFYKNGYIQGYGFRTIKGVFSDEFCYENNTGIGWEYSLKEAEKNISLGQSPWQDSSNQVKNYLKSAETKEKLQLIARIKEKARQQELAAKMRQEELAAEKKREELAEAQERREEQAEKRAKKRREVLAEREKRRTERRSEETEYERKLREDLADVYETAARRQRIEGARRLDRTYTYTPPAIKSQSIPRSSGGETDVWSCHTKGSGGEGCHEIDIDPYYMGRINPNDTKPTECTSGCKILSK